MRSMKEIKEKYFKQLKLEKIQAIEENSQIIENFIDYCKKKNVNLTKDNFNFVQPIGIIAEYPNLLNLINNNLVKEDEELISFKNLKEYYHINNLNAGYLIGENYMPMAHSFFRRRFNENANFAPNFINEYWKLKDENIDVYIALDPNRIKVDIDGPQYFEFDTWYGASFNKEIQKIQNGLIKLRPPLHIDDFDNELFFNNAYSIDIKWSQKKSLKTFQAEEFKTNQVKIRIDNEEYYPVRYIHSEYDINKKYFIHFDGAIHLYSKDEYYQRRDTDFNFNEKIEKFLKPRTFKTFKMNGKISPESWTDFSCQFFTKNPLMIEYFEGKYPENITNFLSKL